MHALFQSDMTPAKSSAAKDTAPPSISMGAMSGKAGAWLAKGRHAVQKVESRLDRKKVDVFVVPAAACVKLTNMGAANLCVDDLAHLMEADESARVVREHKLADAFPRPKQYRFSVTVLRGQNLLTKSAKPADALVTVTDKATGERLFKSRTVLETEDPKWEQTFEVIVSSAIKTLDLTALDRQLMGKHDAIGSRSFKLDPAMFSNVPVRDVVLPLSPRGVVHLRVALDAGEIPDVTYHLTSASRVLENTASDMTLEIVDCMAEFIAGQLSRSALLNVTKPLRDKKKPRIALTEVEISNSLSDVCNYLDANVGTRPSISLTPVLRLQRNPHTGYPPISHASNLAPCRRHSHLPVDSTTSGPTSAKHDAVTARGRCGLQMAPAAQGLLQRRGRRSRARRAISSPPGRGLQGHAHDRAIP